MGLVFKVLKEHDTGIWKLTFQPWLANDRNDLSRSLNISGPRGLSWVHWMGSSLSVAAWNAVLLQETSGLCAGREIPE